MLAMEAPYMDGEEEQEHPAHGEMVAHIVEKLRHDILEHRFAPGSRLVENDLTHRFHVSRGPIREALRRLAAEGLIEHLPNRGALVRKLSRNEIRELFEIRIELEALAARLAANARRRSRTAQVFRGDCADLRFGCALGARLSRREYGLSFGDHGVGGKPAASRVGAAPATAAAHGASRRHIVEKRAGRFGARAPRTRDRNSQPRRERRRRTCCAPTSAARQNSRWRARSTSRSAFARFSTDEARACAYRRARERRSRRLASDPGAQGGRRSRCHAL